jgi:hypothetical protein
MLISDEFRACILKDEHNPFAELVASICFEDTGKGRQGAVLVKPDEAGDTPIVRTTTRYRHPAQAFGRAHERLAQQIQDRASVSLGFNNALIESYTNAYVRMGSHSDQALDLADQSVIAIFSCYRDPGLPPRKLIIEAKQAGGLQHEIPLTHLGVVLFSLDTNRRFKHKIVLDTSARTPENQWLGITFRTSRTLVRWHDERAHFLDGTRLTLADEEQRREFFHLRGRENNEVDFTYPRLTYTLSESDLIPPR